MTRRSRRNPDEQYFMMRFLKIYIRRIDSFKTAATRQLVSRAKTKTQNTTPVPQ